MNILNQAKNNYLYIYFYFYIYLFKKTKSVSNQNFDRPSNQNNKKIVFFFLVRGSLSVSVSFSSWVGSQFSSNLVTRREPVFFGRSRIDCSSSGFLVEIDRTKRGGTWIGRKKEEALGFSREIDQEERPFVRAGE